jgi:hypothetical protein
VTTSGSPTVLRLSATLRTRDDRGPELSRLFGRAVHVEVLLREFDPRVVAARAQEVGAHAVLADVFRGDLAELVRLVAPSPVLRPVFVRQPGQHSGVPVERFAGYGRLTVDGEVVSLPDLAFASGGSGDSG